MTLNVDFILTNQKKKLVTCNRKGGVVLFLFWYRIIAARSPWIASGNTFASKPDAFYDTPFLNSVNGIL